VAALCNDVHISGAPVVHVGVVEGGGPDQFNELFQAVAVLRRLVGPVAFRGVTVGAVRQTWGCHLVLHSPVLTAGLFVSGPGVVSSTYTILGPHGVLAHMESPAECTYLERWSASIIYTMRAITGGPEGVRHRNREETMEVLSKLKVVGGALNVLLGR
jgi:hypothetical protein